MDLTINNENVLRCNLWQNYQNFQCLLQAIVESSKIISIYSLDKAYRLIFFNSTHRDILKKYWGVDIKLGMCFPDIFDSDNRSKSIELYDRALAGEHVHLTVEWKDPVDKKISRYYDNTYTPIISSNGEIIALTAISINVTAQKIAEKELKNYQKQLEKLVQIRTRELSLKEKELRGQKQDLEEANIALRVLLNQRERDKKTLEENIQQNTEQLIIPYLQRMKQGRLTAKQATLLQLLENNFMSMISPFLNTLSHVGGKLSPMETQVADLVRAGKTNDEIAELLCVALTTVATHRQHIRKKLGLKNKKINLKTYLESLLPGNNSAV